MIGFFGYWFIKDFADLPKLIAVGSFIILFGFAFSGPLPLINAIVADISDKLNLEGGENISGTVFSYLTTLTKIGFALGGFVALFGLGNALGF